MKDVRPSDFCVTTDVALGQKSLETSGVKVSQNNESDAPIWKQVLLSKYFCSLLLCGLQLPLREKYSFSF